MSNETVLQTITAELNQARQAQRQGKAGLARVCARRAAGWAIQEYLIQQGAESGGSNAFDQIKHFATLKGHAPEIYTILEHLTVKVAKDSPEEDAYYPIVGVDLVAEAVWLAESLLGLKLELQD